QPRRTLGLHRAPIPARRSRLGVSFAPVLAARLGLGLLVPHMVGADRIAGRIGWEARAAPGLIGGGLDELFDANVQRLELGRDHLAVDNHAGRGPAALAPLVAVLVGRVVCERVIPDARVDQVGWPYADLLVGGIDVVEEIANVIPDRRCFLTVVEE